MSVAAELASFPVAAFDLDDVFARLDFPCEFVAEFWGFEEDVAFSPVVEEDEVGLLDRRARLSTIVTSW
jgi:hypothetical protein